MKIVKILGLVLLHIIFIGVILFSFWPIASWYLNHQPILGVDFYHTATWIRFFKDNLHLIQHSYLDFWYAGIHIISFQVINWYRVYSLVAQFLPLIFSIKVTSLAAFFLMLVFVYLGTFRLSRNPFVALALAILVTYSSNMYGSLTWGGSIPYFANQLFFPLLLWVYASFLESGNKRWYYFGILALGFAVAGHVANAAAFGLPASLILILLGKRKSSTRIKTRIKEAFILIVGMELLVNRFIGQFWLMLISLFSNLLSVFKFIKLPAVGPISTSQIESSQISADPIAEFYRNIFYKVFTNTNSWLLVGLGVAVGLFIVAVIISRRRREALSVIAWATICLYSVLHVYLNANGISFLAQGWYRAFWQFPVTLAFLIASLVGVTHTLIGTYGRVFKIGIFSVWTVLAVTAGVAAVVDRQAEKTILTLEKESSPSSAFPEALGLIKSDADLEKLKKTLLPPWIESKDKNYRIFHSDAQVIVWWNAMFDVPQVRGYLDAPGNPNQHHLLEQAVAGGGLVENYKYPEDIARNMALYYIDWYAVKYGEGGHLSQSPNKPPSTYLDDVIAQHTEVETHGAYILYETKSGKPEIHDEVPQYLKYYRFKDEITSPIVTVSNAPSLACFCDYPAYESLVKILSMHGVHSRKLVSLYIPEAIDSFSETEIKNFDTVLLSNYSYKNRNNTFKLLGEYLKSGGKLVFDTGGEVKESESKSLPEWFPFKTTERGGLGVEWNLEVDTESEIFRDVNIEGFGPPVFDQSEWNFSYPVGDLKPVAQILLKQNDKPLLTKSAVGDGTLYWSGMNIVYHTQYYTNVPESLLFINILTSLVPIEEQEYTEVKPTYRGSNVIDMKSQTSGHGILIKRQMYDTWSAKVKGQQAKIIKAGPSYPGFMYIPLQTKGPIEARVAYIGYYRIYILWFVSVITTVILLDLAILNGALLTKYLRMLIRRFSKRTAVWWAKEEE